jgi:hypothetical protein
MSDEKLIKDLLYQNYILNKEIKGLKENNKKLIIMVAKLKQKNKIM